MKTSLVIMAAGIGSRYGGGIKQLAPAGPNGEIIMDYSIYDALRSGFDKVVFIIRKDLEKDFRDIIGKRVEKVCDTAYAFQEKDLLPEKYLSYVETRMKPWGTGHAILSAKNCIDGPFAVINADDYYGRNAFSGIAKYLSEKPHTKEGIEDMCLAGYILKNTLSENGGVSRGVCGVNDNMELVSLVETHKIEMNKDGVVTSENGGELSAEAYVSMNLWGLRETFLPKLEEGFYDFLEHYSTENPKEEYLLPSYINSLINQGKALSRVLPTHDKWFGITYKEDLPKVQEAFKKFEDEGIYKKGFLESFGK